MPPVRSQMGSAAPKRLRVHVAWKTCFWAPSTIPDWGRGGASVSQPLSVCTLVGNPCSSVGSPSAMSSVTHAWESPYSSPPGPCEPSAWVTDFSPSCLQGQGQARELRSPNKPQDGSSRCLTWRLRPRRFNEEHCSRAGSRRLRSEDLPPCTEGWKALAHILRHRLGKRRGNGGSHEERGPFYPDRIEDFLNSAISKF